MSYNSAHKELFLADNFNKVVRTIHLQENTDDICDVYRTTNGTVSSACYMRDSDTLLLCLNQHQKEWLVVLSRSNKEWREECRTPTNAPANRGMISCALINSRVLIGLWGSEYMELFHVESGPHITRSTRIHLSEQYRYFSATRDRDTLVAMSYESDNSVRVHRLSGERLEELARITLKCPKFLLYIAYRLLATDELNAINNSEAIIELELSGKRLERCGQLIATNKRINVHRWCALDGGFAIVDGHTGDLLHYKF